MPLRSLARATPLALLLFTGCDAHSDAVCTREAAPAVAVAVYDAASGASLAPQAQAVVRTASGEARLAVTDMGGRAVLAGGAGVTGPAALVVAAPGYATWTADVLLDEDACPVVPPTLTARLLPE